MKIDITPSLNIFSTYKNYSYKMTSALFEYYDNSTSSFFQNGKSTDDRYIVTLVDRRDKNNTKLMIIDNAFGMNQEDFIRAIRIDNKQKMSERNKFGVGLKVSAVWFSDIWSIDTLEYGTNDYRSFEFDLKKIQASTTPEFDAEEKKSKYIGQDLYLDFSHGTIITLNNPRDLPTTKNSVETLKNGIANQFTNDIVAENVKFIIAEIKENANGSIEFHDQVEKYFGDGKTKYIRQRLTSCTPVKPNQVEWAKIDGHEEKIEINFDVINPKNKMDMYTITGIVGWIKNSGVGKGGFKRVWKKRALENNLWKPEQILGKPNGYIAQRMYGELDFSHFEPTNSKDGFIISSELEEEIITKLNEATLPLKRTINKKSKEIAKQKKINNKKDIERSFDESAKLIFNKEKNFLDNDVILSDVDDPNQKEALYRICGKNVQIFMNISENFTNSDLINLTNKDDEKFVYHFSINKQHDLIRYASEDNLSNITRMIYLICYSEIVARVSYYVNDEFRSLSHINNINMKFFEEEENE